MQNKVMRRFLIFLLMASPAMAQQGIGVAQCVTTTTSFCADQQAGADWSVKVNAAFTALGATIGRVDASNFSTGQVMSVNVTIPVGEELILPPVTVTRNAGIQFLLNNQVHIHGTHIPASVIASANTTTDFSAVFSCAAGCDRVELDHFSISATTLSGSSMPITSVNNNAGGNTVYNGTFTACATNACAGQFFQVSGIRLVNSSNRGFFTVTSSTNTTLTLANTQGQGETAAGFARQAGAIGISGSFSNSNWHDLYVASAIGVRMAGTYYNRGDNIEIRSGNGAMFVATTSSNFTHIVAWANEDSVVGYANSMGFGVWCNQCSNTTFAGIDSENTKYPLLIDGFANTFSGIYAEDSFASLSGVGANNFSRPIIEPGSRNNTLSYGGDNDILDLTGGNNGTSYGNQNYYATFNSPYPLGLERFFGSLDIVAIPEPQAPQVSVGAGSGATTYTYFLVAVDGQGRKTLASPSGTVVNNAVLTPGTAYNSIATPGLMQFPGIQCYDILVADTAHSLATCVLPSQFPVFDDGTASHLSYTAPTRNTTGDFTLAVSKSAGGPYNVYRAAFNSPNPLIFNIAPTISAHFNTSGDSISANNGTAAFTVTIGTGAGTSTGTIGLPTATTGWNCFANNNNRADLIQQTGGTTATAVFTNYGLTIGTPVNFTNSDVIKFSCFAY